MRLILGFLIFVLISACTNQKQIDLQKPSDTPYVVVLGIAQDAGFPQTNCKKSCCSQVWNDLSKREKVSSIGLCDPKTKTTWLFDATPDFKDQLSILQSDEFSLKGIFLTHGHMGHYTGLLHLGKEAMGANAVSTFVMPRMASFLKDNGPWSQLVDLKNIQLEIMTSGEAVSLGNDISVTPLLVPHRDEFTETVGYVIAHNEKELLFIPDIDKWHKWDTDILKLIERVDYALVDATFYRNGEIRGRDMSLIPHPFVEESLELFSRLSEAHKRKIHFIHLNHTNPLLDHSSEPYKFIEQSPYSVCYENQIFEL